MWVVAILVVTAPSAGDGFATRHVVTAARIQGQPPTRVDDVAWSQAEALAIRLYPQLTVRLSDRQVNAKLASAPARSAWIKAVHSERALAVWVRWTDVTAEALAPGQTDAFGDAVAIEFPTVVGAPLPHIGMGDDKHHVLVHLKRAKEGGTYDKQFVAAGFGSLTEVPKTAQMDLAYDATAKHWTAVFARPLQDADTDLRRGFAPIGVAVWDGAARERGGNKAVASWKFLRLTAFPNDDALWRYAAWGEDGAPVGSAERGETLAAQYCVACHRFGSHQAAPHDLAPDLNGIGGYATAQYLREAVVDPNAVVVRHPNIRRHYDKAGERDRFGAHAVNLAFTWFFALGDARHSKMPPFAHLPPADINDMVAYLQSLKTEEVSP